MFLDLTIKLTFLENSFLDAYLLILLLKKKIAKCIDAETKVRLSPRFVLILLNN